MHRDTGQVLQFTDDLDAPEQEIPTIGLVDFMDPVDVERLRKSYTDYELLSGGA